MIDTEVSSAQPPWLLLLHRLPPEPAYLRVKVRRRLQKVGAVLVKNSVYVLPNREETLEDLLWVTREIESEGGEAMVCEASFVAGVSNAELATLFERPREAGSGPAGAVDRIEPGSIWVTRQGVFVDRIASAWLIRRFIDHGARFKFVPARGYQPAAGELRFDMFEGEFTHDGDRCTFEVLQERFVPKDRALRAVAELVHDIDCKDEKFGRAEVAGLAMMMQGLKRTVDDDATRIARGAELLDALYEEMKRSRA
ncbi:MAG: chromate resistance protein [Gemmatimonadota bacterium]|nr:chromate resistance protein [Gemmatimonadota bacterium]